MEEVAEVKVTRYGEQFLSIIREHCEENNMDMDCMPEQAQITVMVSQDGEGCVGEKQRYV